jgi:ribosomal protein S18 acetylase RimI-like enzyme
MHISIRQAIETDLEALTQLGEITFREAYAAQNTAADMDFYLRTYMNRDMTLLDLRDAGTVFYVAETPTQLVGYVKLKKMPHDLLGQTGVVLELKRIYVLKEHYGKGIAQLLLKSTEEYAVQMGLPGINLAVWKENPRAIAFYLKEGFETKGETTFDWGTGKIDSDWVMVKKISSNNTGSRQ